MSTRANPDDEAALERYAAELADAIDESLPRWVRRSVERFVPIDESLEPAVDAAARRLRGGVGAQVRSLLMTDLDEQRTTPLALLRRGVAEPTEILRGRGVAPVARDEFEERSFPDDVYRLSPATFAEIDSALHDPGLRWGAAKAFVFKQRRLMEGRR